MNNIAMEYWYARELQQVLEYKEWRKFGGVINKAKMACGNSNINAFDQFVQVDKLIQHGKGGMRKIKDYKLTRYACYLIVQNSVQKKIKKSKLSCKNSNNNIEDHFPRAGKMVSIGSKTLRKIKDYKLSR